MATDARTRFLEQLRSAVHDGTLVKLTLGKHRGADATLQNLFVRPVTLKSGPHLAFVWRHATRDVTKNHVAADALARIEPLVGTDFLDAHLFTPTATLQLECQPDGSAKLRTKQVAAAPAAPASHDRAKAHLIPADSPWLRALGVTNDRGQPREGMADKFRQIQKFAELLSHLVAEAALPSDRPLTVVDMGSGKGYLTFAVAALLGERARVQGIEARSELVELCNRVARDHGFADRLAFSAGTIADTPVKSVDVLIALHACDTATDDALAKGIAAQAALLVVSPCCQKELRPQLRAPTVLADALRHGIFQERQAEFVTDALRAELLEWAGYRTRVFEFISTEHTAKNLMIAAIKAGPAGDLARAERLRQLATFYGIRHQQLAAHLGVSLIE
ncbi:MAG TPA: SAM-dependent methyltransferase [Opitutaceae bacterium]|nr:SAM-dependent methyltransferase [Opitutaceae bacterium]